MPSQATALVGASVSMTCEATGDCPEAKVSWSREVGDLPTSSTVTDGRLEISGVKRGDGGVYVCTAENIVQNVTATTTLTVHGRVQQEFLLKYFLFIYFLKYGRL